MEISLGERLKNLRGSMTQEQFALMLGIDRSTLSSWEIGRREPDIASLCKIADIFKVSVDWLVGRCSHQTLPDNEWSNLGDFAKLHGLTPLNVKELIGINIKIAQLSTKQSAINNK